MFRELVFLLSNFFFLLFTPVTFTQATHAYVLMNTHTEIIGDESAPGGIYVIPHRKSLERDSKLRHFTIVILPYFLRSSQMAHPLDYEGK